MMTAEWALYPWFEERGRDMLHPDDVERFKALMPYGKVFQLNGIDGDFVVLQYGAAAFRVKSGLIQKIGAPAFAVGDPVRVRGVSSVGEVTDVCWHHKESRPFFHVAISGKKKSRRFWENELEKA